jgi:hypothetical protein
MKFSFFDLIQDQLQTLFDFFGSKYKLRYNNNSSKSFQSGDGKNILELIIKTAMLRAATFLEDKTKT